MPCRESMMDFVRTALEDADVLLYMVEIGEKALKDEQLFAKLQKTDTPLLLLLNKIDTSNQETLEAGGGLLERSVAQG